jgi:hypothetical protein
MAAMATATINTTKVYRFKFSEHTNTQLKEFSSKNRFTEIPQFKEEWTKWCLMNSELIDRECRTLIDRGYKGDKDKIKMKMYKSVRYYYKNKSSEKKEPKKRKTYIGLTHETIELMDEHIGEVAFKEKYKPQFAYNNFVSNSLYNKTLDMEFKRLENENNMTELESEQKIKKTYKNRYYLKQKRERSD